MSKMPYEKMQWDDARKAECRDHAVWRWFNKPASVGMCSVTALSSVVYSGVLLPAMQSDKRAAVCLNNASTLTSYSRRTLTHSAHQTHTQKSVLPDCQNTLDTTQCLQSYSFEQPIAIITLFENYNKSKISEEKVLLIYRFGLNVTRG